MKVSIKRHLMWFLHSIKYVDRWKFLTFVQKKAFLVLSSKCFIKERSFGQLDGFLRLCSLFCIFPLTHFHQGLWFGTGSVQTGAALTFYFNNIWGRECHRSHWGKESTTQSHSGVKERQPKARVQITAFTSRLAGLRVFPKLPIAVHNNSDAQTGDWACSDASLPLSVRL